MAAALCLVGAWAAQASRVSVGRDNSLFLVYPGGKTVVRVSVKGELLADFRENDSEEAKMQDPSAVTIAYYPDPRNHKNGAILFGGWQIAVTDAGSHRLLLFSSEGEFSRAIGKEGKGEGEFSSPGGIACDTAGNLVVADTGNNRLQIVSARGQFRAEIKLEEGEKPLAVAVDSRDNIYAATGKGIRVFSWSSTDKKAELRQTLTASGAQALAVNRYRRLAALCKSKQILFFDKDLKPQRSYDVSRLNLSGDATLCYDTVDNLVLADTATGRVWHLSADLKECKKLFDLKDVMKP